MKLVSPKTLLASLLGCTFVVMKVMTFDGLVDMFWIIFIGYLTVKAIVTAFSQEAYDEDIRQAQQGKVLYRDLFGKFAYIAADVPILLILLAGLLASVCSATTLLRATLIGLLLIAVGYAIWFKRAYICFRLAQPSLYLTAKKIPQTISFLWGLMMRRKKYMIS